MKNSGNGRFLVVGAGIAGLRTALDLAEMGHRVWLIDREAQPGGRLIQLDHQFPNNHCGMCRMLPVPGPGIAVQACVRKGIWHPNIKFLGQTTLTALSGTVGDFQAQLQRRASRVDSAKCDGCGQCAEICPVSVPDTFNAGTGSRKAIYQPSPYRDPKSYVVDAENCAFCGECETVCPQHAIRMEQEDQEISIEIDAVVLATGYSCYRPEEHPTEFGYDLPNVVDSLQFERILSGTGPFHGTLHRLTDHKTPRRIAWLQCVGSRDLKLDADYCSSVCCMFSIKQAVLVKQCSRNSVDTTIFYMDLRTFGRENERYRQRAEKEYGVRFVRARVHSVEFAPEDGSLLLQFLDSSGNIHQERFDLVVLASGQRPGRQNRKVAALTGINLNPWGFFQTERFSAGRTNRAGIFVAGPVTGPQDISESITSASAVALEVLATLPGGDGSIPHDQVESRTLSLSRFPAQANIPVTERALVVGGGIAGMTAALAIADQGYPVDLIEASESLGGNMKQRRYLLGGGDPQKFLREVIVRVERHPRITVHLFSTVQESVGQVGNFVSVVLPQQGKPVSIRHGVTIVATGGREHTTESYGYGSRQDILSQNDIEQQLHGGTLDPQDLTSVVMIQCVDSREEPRAYCSRICCLSALKNALFMKRRNPELDIYILYRDCMAYGFHESYYTEARRSGILFIPYDPDRRPKVGTDREVIWVEIDDPILDRRLKLRADLLILSTGVVPAESGQLTSVFGLAANPDGFLLEMDYKWRPVETSNKGVFVCGLARTPCTVSETVVMAEAAAMHALRILRGARVKAGARTASVHESLCMGCKICVQSCPFDAVIFSEATKKSSINAVLCQGCGSCVVACPVSAIELQENAGPETAGERERNVA